jgi:hypothetical protein
MNNFEKYKPPQWIKPDELIDARRLNKLSCLVLEKKRRNFLKGRVNSIYLSGGMEYSEDYGIGWRDRLIKELEPAGYSFFNPPSEERGILSKYEVTPSFVSDLKQWRTLARAASIVSELLDADYQEIVKNSEALILYYDASILGGGGSAMEVGWAWEQGLPVFLVIGKGVSLKNVSLSLISKATHVFTSLEGLVYHLKWAKKFEEKNKISPLYKRKRSGILAGN